MSQTTAFPVHRRATGSVRVWPQWVLLVLFTFIALESILLAVAMQGRWVILLAPGAVCASKAWETWNELKRRVTGPIRFD